MRHALASLACAVCRRLVLIRRADSQLSTDCKCGPHGIKHAQNRRQTPTPVAELLACFDACSKVLYCCAQFLYIHISPPPTNNSQSPAALISKTSRLYPANSSKANHSRTFSSIQISKLTVSAVLRSARIDSSGSPISIAYSTMLSLPVGSA